MKRLWVNFVRPLPPRLLALRYGLLMTGLLVLSYSLWQQWQLSREAQALSWQQQNLQRLDKRQSAGITSKLDDEKTQDAIKRARAVLHQLNLPWDQLFPSLENAAREDIAIMSILPNSQTGSITLQAAATNINAAINFADRLKAQKPLSGIYMLQEEPLEVNARFPLQFKISADWNTGS
jgi:hypothetical protein